METRKFTFEKLPDTLEELNSLPEVSLDDPFKAAALTVCALCTYTKNREEGIKMLNFLKGPKPLTNMDIQFINDRFMDDRSYVIFSYFEGTTPDNNYTPSVPYTLNISDNAYSYQEEGYVSLSLTSSGADSPRKITLRQKGNQWFLWQQYLLPDIRKPKNKDPWA